ncbi:MAG TPA: hypothetical protein VF581_05195 [Flavobacterium sp.]|jgi:hypothetical protein
MKKRSLLMLIMLLPMLAVAQLKVVIKDSISGKPIPYVAVMSADNMFGISSDKNGEFLVPTVDAAKGLYFDVVGYKDKAIKTLPASKIVLLQPGLAQPALQVVRKKSEINASGVIVDEFDLTKTSSFYSKPTIVAKYFPYEKKYEGTPYLNKVFVDVISKLPNAVYKLRIFAVGSDGTPGEDVLQQDFVVTAKKGDAVDAIDVSQFNIKFDPKGMFVGVETVIVNENQARVPWRTDLNDPETEVVREIYQPTFRGNSIRKGTLWRHLNGKWSNLTTRVKQKRKRSTLYSVNNLFLEIELSN